MIPRINMGWVNEFLKGRFSLLEDNATQEEIHNRMESGVIVRGTNLWILIFATFIASIGLNVNSTAVIIGAMLISPLMGPIMGMGYSLGTNDSDLLKRSAKNYGFMTIIAILASTCYFIISPWTGEQSELLARTQPTTWDVLIAFFGGLAGMVGQTRQDKTSTVVPGVAIATALMPPLCTAGFGLATGQIYYFFGAFYLFIINTVFIAIATFVITNSMKLDKKVFDDPAHGKKVKKLMAVIIFVTIVPSVFIGYNLICEAIFKQNVNNYIEQTFKFEGTEVMSYNTTFKPGRSNENKIEIVLYGKTITTDVIEVLRAQMPNYDIYNTSLSVLQGQSETNLASTFIQSNFEQLIKEKNEAINHLNEEVSQYKNLTIQTGELTKELSAIVNKDIIASISRSVLYDNKGIANDTILVCFIKHEDKIINEDEATRIREWLKVRTNTDTVHIVFEKISRPQRNRNTEESVEKLNAEKLSLSDLW